MHATDQPIEKVLVTGAAGFLGSHIVDRLGDQGYKVYAMCHSSPLSVRLTAREPQIEPVRSDILDLVSLEEVVKEKEVEAIVHVAALLLNDWITPRALVEANITGTLNMLEAARLFDVKRFIFASSCAVYGNTAGNVVDEQHPTNPTNLYGTGKLLGEMYGLDFSSRHGLDFVALRFSSIYGPGRERGPSIHREIVENAVSGRPLHLPSGADHMTDWVYVKDCAEAAIRVLSTNKLAHRIFNIASGKHYTLADIGDAVKKMIPEADIRIGPGLYPGMDVRGVIDISRARRELAYDPQYDLYSGLREYVDYLRSCGQSLELR
jgi:nucleoside-diphosphate-sugar epimerase